MHADLALLESGRSVMRLRGIERRLEVAQRVGVAILLLTALIAGGWWWQARQTRVVRNLAGENARLAEGNAQLARESQQRVVRLAVANGARLLDKNDATGALLWFADVLPLMTNSPVSGNAKDFSLNPERLAATVGSQRPPLRSEHSR